MTTMFRIATWLIFLLAFVFYSCKDNSDTLFKSLDPSATGINFKNTLFEDGPLNVANYIYFYNGGGVAVGDINNDGLQDVLFTGNMVRNRLFLNKGDFQFEDITPRSGVAEKQGWCTGANMVDINNDGRTDIYICRSADAQPHMRKNLLFINNGDLTFSEKAEEFGLADPGYSTQAAFLDFDKDGDLDCFIINHSSQKYTGGVQDNPALRKEYNPASATKLYRNDNNRFTDISLAAGITSNVLSFGLGVAVSDFNNDGWPDISVSNDFNEPDYFFINNRDGTFTEQLSKSMDQVSLFSMGSDAADYNNDGLIDLVTLDMLPEDNKTIKMHSGAENFDKFQYLFSQGFYYQYSRNMLQKNNGDGTFSEVGQLAGVSNTDWSWAALLADYDRDGHKDLFVSNGYVKDYTEMDFLKYSVDRVIKSMHKDSVDPIPVYIQKMPTIEIPNYIYQNQGNGTFVKKASEWGFTKKGVSAGAAYADFDNDGDLDLVVSHSNDFARVYKNRSEVLTKNNYLSVQLEGATLNRAGLGAKVKVFCKGQQFYQEQAPARGFQSSSDPVLNFGIGTNTLIDSLLVIWPNDNFQKLVDVKPNQKLTLKFSDAKEKWRYDTTARYGQSVLLQDTISQLRHRENTFSDFTVQGLLPNYLSRQGPCIEIADINKDGREDIFIGGAKGQPSELYIQNSNKDFSFSLGSSLEKNALSENVAATFFDADGDGDTDLYVANGGYEFNENDSALQDVLYLNDGKGNFKIKPDALPVIRTSKSTVKHADVDGDGDIDVFVGGRVVPGKYPTSPRSYILLNDGKAKFTDATSAVCPALQNPGMVTDALWTDLNNDKFPDLFVVGEWMPIKIFVNSRGKLTDASATYIKFPSTGWWNRINATDMDNDGDMDVVIGNCGLNTQFRVNEKEPMTIHYKDFDNNGSIDPILCYYIGGVSYPIASRDDLTDQLPGLKKKFLEYKQYANATINDIFTTEQLKDAATAKAELMETVYLENLGANGFARRPLPMQAQYSPIYGIVLDDLDRDGKKDILLAGNNTWTRIRFGRYSANHGVLLKGDGKNAFTYLPQPKSGLNLRGNVRTLKPIQSGDNKKVIAGINDDHAIMISTK